MNLTRTYDEPMDGRLPVEPKQPQTMTECMRETSRTADLVLQHARRIHVHLFGDDQAGGEGKADSPRCFREELQKTNSVLFETAAVLERMLQLLGVGEV